MSTTFQAPPGTRDFYPEQMALRRYIEDTWRRVSLRHGFQEVDGPTFEFLDLYKIKSGDEIVSQLFHFESRADKQGQADEFALRPEFTPTLARMIAAKANALPRPIKWFSIPRCYRAERPQKGRLREFIQWNVDMLGGETPETQQRFDVEVAALCLDCLKEFGLDHTHVRLLWNNRYLVEDFLNAAGFATERLPKAFALLDKLQKLAPAQRQEWYKAEQFTPTQSLLFDKLALGENPLTDDFWQSLDIHYSPGPRLDTVLGGRRIDEDLGAMGFAGYAQYDASIVRGLAYYTGFVWEIADVRRENRALAGGGRYDRLIEMFGGPPFPATGFGMGDVVLANVLQECGKLPKDLTRAPAPQVFIVNALSTADAALRLLGSLRAAKIAVAASYKTTKNIGKLLQEASASGAKWAIILAPAEWDRGVVKLKNLATREEKEIPPGEVASAVGAATA